LCARAPQKRQRYRDKDKDKDNRARPDAGFSEEQGAELARLRARIAELEDRDVLARLGKIEAQLATLMAALQPGFSAKAA